MAEIADLFGLDRDVARAARAPESVASALRHVAGQSTFERLGALDVAAHDAPLRDALRRWVYALLQTRTSLDLAEDERAAVAEPRGRYEGDPPRLVSWREAWRGVVSARTAALSSEWLRAAVDAAPPIAAIARERAARRLEVARRLGLAHPADLLAPAPIDKVRTSARELLARTDDLAAHALREALGRGTAPSFCDAVQIALAKDAGEGWPPRLLPRWLEDLFGEATRGLALDLPPLPEAIGASSFARALASFGHALRVAMAPRGLPFAVAHEPWPTAAHRFAYVFGALPSSPEFHLAALKTSRRVALAQARSLARSALFEARLAAARVLLDDEAAFAPRDRFEELTARLYGAPLATELAGAWPLRRRGEPSRFAALVTAPHLLRDLVERFDRDWFRNPRAWPHLRAIAAGPARAEEPLDLDAAPLARAFEEALA